MVPAKLQVEIFKEVSEVDCIHISGFLNTLVSAKLILAPMESACFSIPHQTHGFFSQVS